MITSTFPFDFPKYCMPDRFGFMYDCGPDPQIFNGTVSSIANFGDNNTVHFDGANNFDGDITYSCGSNNQLNITATLTMPFTQDTSGLDIELGDPVINVQYGNSSASSDGSYALYDWNLMVEPCVYFTWYNALQLQHRYFTTVTVTESTGSTGYRNLYVIYAYPPASMPHITWYGTGSHTITQTFICVNYHNENWSGFDIELFLAPQNHSVGKISWSVIEQPYYCSLWYKERNGTWTRLLVAANTTSASATVTI